TGPSAGRPGFASIGEAMGGIRFVNGFPDTPPPRFGISLGDTLTAMFAVEGFLMALFERQANDGKGQVVDAAITESCFSMLESTLPEFDKCGIIRQPSGTGLANVAPSNIYPTSDDNFVVVAANLDAMFKRLCEAMDKIEWASDPRFVDHKARGNNASQLDGLIADWTKTLTIKEIGQKLDDHGVVWGPINSIKDITEDKQFKSRDMILEIEDETFGSLKVPGIVPKLSKTPGQVAWLGPQIAGAHNKEVLSDLGFTEEEQKELLDKKII
ncbi:CoA transferase, partial [Rhodobacteraceae bacterium]|nr:CoA transferase [Paracoccaceae bacterium]